MTNLEIFYWMWFRVHSGYIFNIMVMFPTQKFENFCSSNLWTCLHHMLTLLSLNKITDFWMILDLGMSP